MKRPEGLEVILDLAKDADVVMQNFTPGAADRLGVGYEAIRAINPRVIYHSVSGYGQTGPDRGKRGYDPVLQAGSGFMSITGEKGRGPVKSMAPVADVSTGIYGFAAVQGALYYRERTGEGQHIDLSMFDIMVSMLSVIGSRYLLTGKVPERHGTENPQRVPSAAFKCADGVYLQAVPASASGRTSAACWASRSGSRTSVSPRPMPASPTRRSSIPSCTRPCWPSPPRSGARSSTITPSSAARSTT